jgi:hypothetical protein
MQRKKRGITRRKEKEREVPAGWEFVVATTKGSSQPNGKFGFSQFAVWN